MRLLLSVCINAIIIIHFSYCSHLNNFRLFQDSTLLPLADVADLPTVDAIGGQLIHHLFLALCRNADQQSSTGFSSIPFHEFEVLNLILDFDESTVDGELVDHQVDVCLLRFSEVVGMAEYPEPSDICARAGLVFSQQSSTNQAQGCHLFLCSIECLHQLRLRCFLQNLLPFFLAGLEPLHGVDGKSCSKRFGQDDCITRLRVVGHDKLLVFDDCDCAPAHHWPLVVDSLPAAHLGLGLLSSISESLDHEGRRHIFFEIAHISGDSQDHENFLDISDAHRVEVRYSIAEGYASEHVWRFDERIEEVKSGDECVGGHFDGGDVWGFDSNWFGEFGEVGEQFVLWDLAASSLHLGEVGQDKVALQTMLHRIERPHGGRLAVRWINAKRISKPRSQAFQAVGYSQHKQYQEMSRRSHAQNKLYYRPLLERQTNFVLQRQSWIVLTQPQLYIQMGNCEACESIDRQANADIQLISEAAQIQPQLQQLPEQCPELVRQIYSRVGPYQFTKTYPFEMKQPIQLPTGELYHGQWDERRRNGRGRQVDADGSIYEGYWKDGQQHGEGRRISINGEVYDGEWSGGRMEGKGVFFREDGASFTGEWVAGRQHGYGHEKWPDGTEYEGNFASGLKEGHGLLNLADGSAYEGQFVSNRMEGYGHITWCDGKQYEGFWKKDKMNGKGNFLWPDGRRYEGEYVNDKKEGYGEFIWKDGRVYRGQWKNGKQDGRGVFIAKDGKERSGIWSNGKKIRWME